MATETLYTKGTRIWLKDPDVVWKAGTVVEDFDGKQVTVESEEDGDTNVIQVKNVETDLPPLRNPDILVGENDLTSLSYLHEPAVLHNLEVRFIRNEAIYTYCGIVLVAINPYSDLQIYGNDTISMYRGKNMGDLDPHVYAVAEEAFKRMERYTQDQSIIVSGESGAGKTVSAKYAMRYFATVGGTAGANDVGDGKTGVETSVERRVIVSSPIMEAIGNAKTTRNDNSSRFGKYIEIDFNKQFNIIGAHMRTYLLEKSRVVFQAPQERNYHIFYQLCTQRDEPEFEDLCLQHPDEFFYLNQGDSAEIEGLMGNDEKEFEATREAFKLLGFTESDESNIFTLLAGILHLGNVEFQAGGKTRSDSESSIISEEDAAIKTMASLLEIDEEGIRKWLCYRQIITARETFTKPMNTEAALFARDALSKSIYSRLFDWIVVKVNKALERKASSKAKDKDKKHKFIGVLDIYGFETFEINSFEQFCINFANEKLQLQFNSHVFKLEQEEYIKEGIEWTMIDFYDNQPCIDLIESKLGILDLLNEECRMPKGTDKSWVEKLYEKCGGANSKWKSHFVKPRLSNTAFIVRHFADNVEYECDGFLDKNRDTVMEEQIIILRASRNQLLSSLFAGDSVSAGAGAPKTSSGRKTLSVNATSTLTKKQNNKKTVGSAFGDSLNLLMATLNSTTPHYIRCIKPNDEKAAFKFDNKRGIQQLRACGVLETVRISAAGFPSRWTYHDFHLRYRVLCHSKDIQRNNYRATCEKIVVKLVEDEDKYKLGKTKIFFRAGQVAYMERLRSEKLRYCGIMIQKNVKMWLYRKRYQQIYKATKTIQRFARGFVARRQVHHKRKTKAAITIQKNVRGWVKRKQYQELRERTIRLQTQIRGCLARRRYADLVRNAKAIIIQSHVRSWLERRKYKKTLRGIVLIQCLFRRRQAKKLLKSLKVQAKSVDHQKKLNKGLENKIISLQQKLTESENVRKNLKSVENDYAAANKELETLRSSNEKNRLAMDRVQQLEEEVAKLKADLAKEKEEKVDLVNEKEKEVANAKEMFVQKEEEAYRLEKELETAKRELQEKSETDFQDALGQEKEEKARFQADADQERMAYQKLLQQYNRLEAQLENAQTELNHYRRQSIAGMPGGSVSMASFYSESESGIAGMNADGIIMDDGLFDGSVSGKSSVRSTGGKDRGRLDNIDWKEQGEENATDIDPFALNVKLQQKVKELQIANENLKRKNDKMLGDDGNDIRASRQTEDNVKIQEYEIENNRLKEDMKKLRESLSEGDHNNYLNELNSQYEKIQDELERRREECVQLRTILANVKLEGQPISKLTDGGINGDAVIGETENPPEGDELVSAYETQKRIITQLQEQLMEEKSASREIEGELREELESTRKTCEGQQQLIDQAISGKGGRTTNTEACLQHEITRLTSENFDLRERVEGLNDNKRQYKRMLKAYMKKMSETGTPIPDIDFAAPVEGAVEQGVVESELMPVIRKKDHDYLGIFEYRKEQEEQILKALIYDLKPKVALQMIPGLPAYILFMMIRYTDYVNNESNVRSLIQQSIFFVKKVIKRKGMNDLEVKTLWLSNVLRILNNLMQYSGEKQYQADSTPKQIDQCLRNFDLSEFRRVLRDVAIWIYQGITKLVEEEIQPILVPATLEHEGISGMGDMTPQSSMIGGGVDESMSSKSSTIDPHEALDKLLRLLTRFHAIFTKHGLDPEIISQIFKQIFFYICAGSLNNLLLRKELCHWSRGMQIRYNIAQLEQWARDQKVHDDRSPIIDALAPIVQASQLLQARKSDEDVQKICDMCDELKVSQLIKILNLYTPADEFEERVSPSFVRKIQNKLQARAALENEQQVTLLMDTNFCYAVKFPFYPSSIQLEELEIPEFYNGLHSVLKKV